MNYTSEMIERVVTSPAGLRALDYISPVYSEAEVFLKVLNVICEEMDGLVDSAAGFGKEMIPNEATWALPLWEMAYGIVPGVGTVVDRKVKLMKRIAEKSAANPARLRVLAEQLSGGEARIVEDVIGKKIKVYLSVSYAASVKKLVEDEISIRKPAHLTLEVYFEQNVAAMIAYTGVFSYGVRFTMRQVN